MINLQPKLKILDLWSRLVGQYRGILSLTVLRGVIHVPGDLDVKIAETIARNNSKPRD